MQQTSDNPPKLNPEQRKQCLGGHNAYALKNQVAAVISAEYQNPAEHHHQEKIQW